MQQLNLFDRIFPPSVRERRFRTAVSGLLGGFILTIASAFSTAAQSPLMAGVLFSVGLLMCMALDAPLITTSVGKERWDKRGFWKMANIALSNIAGIVLASILLLGMAPVVLDTTATAQTFFNTIPSTKWLHDMVLAHEARLQGFSTLLTGPATLGLHGSGVWALFIRSILCGFMMCVAVNIRKNASADDMTTIVVASLVPVMVFVACGFAHVLATLIAVTIPALAHLFEAAAPLAQRWDNALAFITQTRSLPILGIMLVGNIAGAKFLALALDSNLLFVTLRHKYTQFRRALSRVTHKTNKETTANEAEKV